MIRSKNVDPVALFAQHPLLIAVKAGASESDLAHGGFVPRYTGKIVEAQFFCAQLTDADDGVRVTIKKNGSEIVTALDPTAAGATVTFVLSDDDFVDGDEIVGHATTGAGDLLVGSFILHVRPLLGGVERALLAPAS